MLRINTLAVAALAAVAGLLAALLPGAAPAGDGLADLLSFAGPTLAGLRAEIDDLTRQAEAKTNAITDDTSLAEAERLEREAGELLEQIDDRRRQIDALLSRIGDDREIRTAHPGGAPGYRTPGDTFDNPDFLSRAVEDALVARMTGRRPEGPATELAGLSLLQLGERVVQARGERVSWANRDCAVDAILARSPGPSNRGGSWLSRRDAMGGLHGTSDFPTLLGAAGNRVLADAYRAAESPLKALGRRRTASDFRALTRVQLSEAPQLEKVNESGEVSRGTMAEAKESFRLATFAKIFGLSRQAIINDDLQAFGDMAAAWGQAAASVESDILVAIVNGAGIVTDDGKTLFHADHGNLAGTGGALSVATLGAARQAMREQKGLDGKTPISVTPRHLLVSPALETAAEQVLAEIAAASVADANPFSGRLQLHVEPRLSGNSWRVFADPSQLAAIEYAVLSGAEGPQVTTREGWDVLGVEYRAVLDFGAGPGDFRAGFLNSGA